MKKTFVKILALCLSVLLVFSLFTACDCKKNCTHVYKNYVCTRCGCNYYTEGLVYTLNESGTGYVVRGKGLATNLEELFIPATHKNLPVTDIAENAFKDEKGIKVLNIADGVKTIGESAFYNCSNIGKARIPSTLIEIDESAFLKCISLKFNSYGNAKYLGNEVNPYFYLASVSSYSIDTIDIHVRCKMINQQSIDECKDLKYSENNGFYYLGSNVNPYIYLAKPVSLSQTQVLIDYNCSIVNPKAISMLESVGQITSHVGNGYFRVEKGCLIDNQNNSIIAGCEVFDLDNSATAIGPYAFAGRKFAEVIISNNITSIGKGAFSNCENLTDVTIAKSVIKMGANVFDGCEKLQNIVLEHDKTPNYWHSNWKGNNNAIVS